MDTLSHSPGRFDLSSLEVLPTSSRRTRGGIASPREKWEKSRTCGKGKASLGVALGVYSAYTSLLPSGPLSPYGYTDLRVGLFDPPLPKTYHSHTFHDIPLEYGRSWSSCWSGCRYLWILGPWAEESQSQMEGLA